MKELIDELRELYLQDKREFIVTFSGGKDSSLVLHLTWEMLRSLDPSQYWKKVHVIMSDTMAETPEMSAYMRRSIAKVQSSADSEGLPIVAHLVQPAMKERFFYNTLGKGLLVPPVKKKMRWCTDRMKNIPITRKIREILAKADISELFHLDSLAIMLLGTRLDESHARAASMRKWETEGKFSNHNTFKEIKCFSPIKYVTNDEIWLSLPPVFGWGTTLEELSIQYGENFLECGVKTDGQGDTCGGNARNGCWLCPVLGYKKDKMLQNLISEGHVDLRYLQDWKDELILMRNDVRYREFERKQWQRQMKKRLEQAQAEVNQTSLFDMIPSALDYEEQKALSDEHHYYTYDRANDDTYDPGGLNIAGRKMMLEKLLYIQEVTGYPLIEQDEIEAIIQVWQDEGYSYRIEDIKPINHVYDGALVLNKTGSVNEKETTTTSPLYYVHQDIDMGRDELVQYINKRKLATGESYYYYTTHCDMGEDEKFVWNQAIFIVCRPDISTPLEARKVIEKWLYSEENKVEDGFDYPSFWKDFAERTRRDFIELESFLEENSDSLSDNELYELNNRLKHMSKTLATIKID